MVFCNHTISMCTAKKKQRELIHFPVYFLGNYRCVQRERECNMFLIKREMLTCLPYWCIWLMAEYTSSTISTVQASELYSWWNDRASGIFSKELALGPPYNVTPAEDAHQSAIEPFSGLFCLFVCLIFPPCRSIANHEQYSTNLLHYMTNISKNPVLKRPKGKSS